MCLFNFILQIPYNRITIIHQTRINITQILESLTLMIPKQFFPDQK